MKNIDGILLLLIIASFIKQNNAADSSDFVLDSSGSIRHSFDQYRQYVRHLLQKMPISPQGHHAGLMIYSGRLRQFTKWALDQPQEKEKLLARVDTLPHLNGATATGVALDVVAARELVKRRRAPTTRTNVVVLTDGFSYDPVEVPSANLHAMPDVRTFAVCLDAINVHSELVTIAGNPDNVFIGEDSKNRLLQKLLDCPAPPPTESHGGNEQQPAADVPAGTSENGQNQGGEEVYGVPGNDTEATFNNNTGTEQTEVAPAASPAEGFGQEVENQPESNGTNAQFDNGGKQIAATTMRTPKLCPTDFLFVLDGSGSLRQRFEHQKEMAADLVDALPQGEGVRIGLVKYSGKGKARVKLPIENGLSRPAIQQLIHEQRFFGGTTFTNEALMKAKGELDKQVEGQKDSNKRNQVILVFTDGMSQEDPTEGANALRAKGALVYSIAVEDGQPVHMRELELIAGDPSRVFTDRNFDQLKEQMRGFAKNC